MDDIAARLASLRDDTDAFIALYDQQDRLRYANRAFRAAFALDDEDARLADRVPRRQARLRCSCLGCAVSRRSLPSR